MDVDTFLNSHQASWDRLSQLVARAGRGASRLSPAELEELVSLYQRTSTHLSYARSTYRDPALTAPLSSLVARAAAVIYGSRPRTLRAIGSFFAVAFPAAVWYMRRFVLAAALLLFAPAFAAGIWISG